MENRMIKYFNKAALEEKKPYIEKWIPFHKIMLMFEEILQGFLVLMKG